MFITFTLIGQAFIQTVLLMPVFEQRLDFRKLQNIRGGLEMLKAPQGVHGGILVRVQRGKSPETFGSFYM